MQQQFSLWKTACLLNVIQNPIVLVLFRLLLDNLVQLINAKIHLRIKVHTLDVEVVKHLFYYNRFRSNAKICPRKSPPFRMTNETSRERTLTAARACYLRYPSKGSACSQAYTAIYDILTFTKTMLPSIKSHATSSGHHWLKFGHREFIIITIIQHYSLRKANNWP